MAEQYGIPVILHTDHCAKKLLPWVDGLLSASERYYEQHGEPLFSSHMIDLSEEPIEENIEICKEYLTRMSKIGLLLEMELGITGGEEDGVDNSDRPIEDLYSKPEEIFQVYQELEEISPMFTGKEWNLACSEIYNPKTQHWLEYLFSGGCVRKCPRCLQTRQCETRARNFEQGTSLHHR
jgi:fructose-bisphosphate aldolase class II